MAYITGQVNSLSDIKNVFEAMLLSDGWTTSNGILSKNGCFLETSLNYPGCLNIVGGTAQSGATLMNKPIIEGARIGVIANKAMTFPAIYHGFSFLSEHYLIIHYDINHYQFLAVGKSTIPLPGSGMWFAGSYAQSYGPTYQYLSIGTNYGGSYHPADQYQVYLSGAIFRDTAHGSFSCSHIYTGLDVNEWKTAQGIVENSNVLSIQPNLYNGESILIPIRSYENRPSSKKSLVCELQFARELRIDHYEPGEILTLGSDEWMIFPWHKKNTTSRNGGAVIDHTGTFGWALKKN